MGGGREGKAPRVARWVVERVSPAEDRIFVLADLDEEFEERLRSEGGGAARRWYRRQVARSFFPLLGRKLLAPLRGGAGGDLGDLASDTRYAFRRIRGTPLQVLVTVASLGIGIGLATTVFAVGNSFLYQAPGGLGDTSGLVAIFTSQGPRNLYQPTSFPDFGELEAQDDLFLGATALRPGIVQWERGETSQRVIVEMVTQDYFDVLAVDLPLGRDFLPEETVPGRAEPRAVLSHEMWVEHFGGDPGVLGQSIRVSGRDFVVVGVAPEGLLGRFLRLKVDLWVPVGLPGGLYHATPRELVDRVDREYIVYARLAQGVSLEQAQARLDVLADRLHGEYGAMWEDGAGNPLDFTVLEERDARVPPDGRAALTGVVAFLLAGTGLILLIACANVAGLFLARASRRHREIAVRLSLGASRGRVVRLLLVEALLVALGGAALGLWGASLATNVMGAIPLPIDAPLAFGVEVDLRVALFAVATALATCVAFGLAPALWASRPDLTGALKGDGGGRPGARMGARGILVTLQVAGSVVLLVGAGLFLRGVMGALDVDRGLDPTGIALASTTLRQEEVDEDAIRAAVMEQAERVAAHPEVADVAVASVPELSMWIGGAAARLEVDGYVPGPDEAIQMAYNAVTPNYFQMVGMKASRGRLLTEADGAGSVPVALVNETFARRYWPGVDPLGRRFTAKTKLTFSTPYEAPERSFTVVGVVPDVRRLQEGAPEPFFWTSFLQDPTPLAVIHARGRVDAASLVPVLQAEIRPDGDDVELIPPRTYEELMAYSLLPKRVASAALGYCGAFALLLAVMGMYGIVSFAVNRRMREMAIRQALGAGRSTVFSAVLMDGLKLAGLGLALGLAVAIPGASFLGRAIPGINPLDPLALGGTVLILAAAAFAATVLPARRAVGADPVAFLREE